MLNSQYYAVIYNYTTGTSFNAHFPMGEKRIKQIMSQGEVMVDECQNLSLPELGMNIKEFNRLINLFNENDITKEQISILSETYLLNEITEFVENETDIHIIDFDEATKSWSSSDFWSEYDKGLVLYNEGFSFPTEVPAALVDYMDYALLWRDCSINNSIREVSKDNHHYLIWHS